MTLKLTITTDTDQEREAALEFLEWLSNSGEQQYWMGMEYHPELPMIKGFDYDLKTLTVTGSSIGYSNDEPECLCQKCNATVLESQLIQVGDKWWCGTCSDNYG